ncbi:hypothetical protein [Vibrio tasmaniensis]|uniref:hypothetical protein n=1 Tax=Vibrio tasmaniensis TaxID=212663 RepID=UPI000313259E|nr:hypothetical protein [Vibrio tasmaniensis]
MLENNALKKHISTKKHENKIPFDEKNISLTNINNLIATIDFLVKATEGIVIIEREKRTITNLALDVHGVLSKSVSSTYFDILEGKL